MLFDELLVIKIFPLLLFISYSEKAAWSKVLQEDSRTYDVVIKGRCKLNLMLKVKRDKNVEKLCLAFTYYGNTIHKRQTIGYWYEC